MSHDATDRSGAVSPEPASTHEQSSVPPGPSWQRGLEEYWGLVLGYGVLTLALGFVLAVWPGETLAVCAVLIAVQLLVSGVVRIATSVATDNVDGGLRTLLALSGASAFIAGLLCLRSPLQTLVVIGLLIGAWWIGSGVVDIVAAVLSPTRPGLGWEVVGGIASVLAGTFLLVNPALSLRALVFVTCAWLIVAGAAAIFSALALRRRADITPSRVNPGSRQDDISSASSAHP